MISNKIKDRLLSYEGDIGIYYIDLKSGISVQAGTDDVFPASGIVKLLVLIEAFRRIQEGKLNKDDKYVLKKEDCFNFMLNEEKTYGVLEYMHEGIELTIEDLYNISMMVSDNTAFNILLKMFTMEEVNKTIDMLGFSKSRVNRLFFDNDKVKKGIDNYVSVSEIAMLLYRMEKGQIISRQASKEMLDIMKHHQKNSVIPHCFDESMIIAHQTGYDTTLLLDMGIVYAENPFVLCMAAKGKNIRNAESVMRDVTLMCYNNSIELNKM